MPPDAGTCARTETPDDMIVNLNQHRKKRRRAEAEMRARENRIRYGRSKAQRIEAAREDDRARKEIDDKRLE